MAETVSFPSNGSTSGGWLAGTSGPGVIVLQEWWGLNDQIKRTTERLAGEGFVALAPDLYHGRVTQSPDEAGRLLMALDIGRAEQDLRGATSYLRARTGDRPVGVVGFCMGGALSLFAACQNGDDVGACVVYYGGHPNVEYDLDRLRAPVLGHWAEHDPSVNARVPALQAALEARGKAFEFHSYPGTKHGFFNEDRPQVHAPEAAAQSWARTVGFFKKLGAPGSGP
jgi:carboxymethylenebutenolidase